MCRYGDDFDWYVDTVRNDVTADTQRRCGDCGRTIEPDEPHVEIDTVNAGYTIYVVLYGQQVDLGYDRADVADAFEALGFDVFEDNLPGDMEIYCAFCRAADEWLRKVCSQDAVGVTAEDLIEHTHEYDGKTLGRSFMRLAVGARRQWRGFTVEQVKQLTDEAIDHAMAAGLVA